MDFYSDFFKDAGNAKAIGEATPSYAFLPFVADRIKNHFPEIKLILCFRNPLDRAFSSWLMQKGMGKEQLPFREAMEMNLKNLRTVSLEGEDGAKTYTDSWGNYSGDESRLRTYIQCGLFAEIVKSYYSRFKPEQIKIVFLDDLKKDFDGFMSSLFKFLNVDDKFIVPNKEVVNFHFDRKASKLTNKLFGVNGTKFLIGITPKFIKNKLKKQWKTKEAPKLEIQDRYYLWEIFKNDIAELEKITGRDLSSWNPTIKKEKAVAV